MFNKQKKFFFKGCSLLSTPKSTCKTIFCKEDLHFKGFWENTFENTLPTTFEKLLSNKAAGRQRF